MVNRIEGYWVTCIQCKGIYYIVHCDCGYCYLCKNICPHCNYPDTLWKWHWGVTGTGDINYYNFDVTGDNMN